MNRTLAPATLPRPRASFQDDEALVLLEQYKADPSDLRCPKCDLGEFSDCASSVEVLAFIETVLPRDGYAIVKPPVDEYAVALYCHSCDRAIGVMPYFAN